MGQVMRKPTSISTIFVLIKSANVCPRKSIRIKFEVLKNVPSDFTQDILLLLNKFLPDHGDRQEPAAIRYIIVYIMESRGPAETKRKLNMQVKQICGIFY